ncbi:DUF2946 family protein [Variovorax sp. ZT4R33]|uniref:DUF2946 family protein n=1 Tax=Variovorax sp. ZT4R33 TaxID=3443743 RepID=UPI003F475547
MALRTLLLRLLLIAAFFNAAIGMPLHEVGHLQELAVAQAADARAIGNTDGEPSEHAEINGLCAWCAAYAAQGMALALVTAFAVPAEAVAPPPVRRVADFVPPGWRWRFAARDPPLALT